jgi:regulator of replication initiation timing
MDKYMTVKLVESQKNTAKNLMNQYSQCHGAIKELEEQMGRLKSEMEFRIHELKSLRQEEEQFHSELEKQYGPGSLDTQNLEWNIE